MQCLVKSNINAVELQRLDEFQILMYLINSWDLYNRSTDYGQIAYTIFLYTCIMLSEDAEPSPATNIFVGKTSH